MSKNNFNDSHNISSGIGDIKNIPENIRKGLIISYLLFMIILIISTQLPYIGQFDSRWPTSREYLLIYGHYLLNFGGWFGLLPIITSLILLYKSRIKDAVISGIFGCFLIGLNFLGIFIYVFEYQGSGYWITFQVGFFLGLVSFFGFCVITGILFKYMKNLTYISMEKEPKISKYKLIFYVSLLIIYIIIFFILHNIYRKYYSSYFFITVVEWFGIFLIIVSIFILFYYYSYNPSESNLLNSSYVGLFGCVVLSCFYLIKWISKLRFYNLNLMGFLLVVVMFIINLDLCRYKEPKVKEKTNATLIEKSTKGKLTKIGGKIELISIFLPILLIIYTLKDNFTLFFIWQIGLAGVYFKESQYFLFYIYIDIVGFLIALVLIIFSVLIIKKEEKKVIIYGFLSIFIIYIYFMLNFYGLFSFVFTPFPLRRFYSYQILSYEMWDRNIIPFIGFFGILFGGILAIIGGAKYY